MNEAHNIANRIIEALNDPNRTVTATVLPMPMRAPLMPMDATAAMPMIAQPAALPIRQTVTVEAPLTNQAIQMYRNALIAQGLDNNEIDRRVSDIQRAARQAVIADTQARVAPRPLVAAAAAPALPPVAAAAAPADDSFSFFDHTPVVAAPADDSFSFLDHTPVVAPAEAAAEAAAAGPVLPPVAAPANNSFDFLDNTPVVDYDDLPDFGL